MDWHRLFGLILADFFAHSPFVVEVEKDLSLKQQFLDVVIIRKQPGEFALRLLDGLEDLANHNLLTFKSYQEALSDWSLKELIGHYVNYRKQVSPSLDKLLPEEEFRLYALCARYPQKLAGQVPLQEVKPGVYDCRWCTDVIRIIVLQQLSQEAHNALGYLFSASRQQVRYAVAHYHKQSAETSTLVDMLLAHYRQENFPMAYTMEDFRKEYRLFVLKDTPVEEILKTIPAEEFLKAIPPEKRLQGLTEAEIEQLFRDIKKKPPSANEPGEGSS